MECLQTLMVKEWKDNGFYESVRYTLAGVCGCGRPNVLIYIDYNKSSNP